MPCNNRLQIPEVFYSFCTAKFFLISTLHLPCWKLGNNISHLIHHRHTAHAIFFLSAFRHFCVCNSTVFSRLSSPSSLNSLQILFSRSLLIPVVFLWSLLQFVHLLLTAQHSTAQHPNLHSVFYSEASSEISSTRALRKAAPPACLSVPIFLPIAWCCLVGLPCDHLQIYFCSIFLI